MYPDRFGQFKYSDVDDVLRLEYSKTSVIRSPSQTMREAEPIMVVDKSNERVRKMFGEIAPKYDRMNHLLSMNVDRYWRWKSVRKLKPNQSDPILDVCTGTGDLAFSFHKYTQGQVSVVGSDFCYEMLEVGREK